MYEDGARYTVYDTASRRAGQRLVFSAPGAGGTGVGHVFIAGTLRPARRGAASRTTGHRHEYIYGWLSCGRASGGLRKQNQISNG